MFDTKKGKFAVSTHLKIIFMKALVLHILNMIVHFEMQE